MTVQVPPNRVPVLPEFLCVEGGGGGGGELLGEGDWGLGFKLYVVEPGRTVHYN